LGLLDILSASYSEKDFITHTTGRYTPLGMASGTEPGGQLPVHDRWWLTPGYGLRFGTSFNGLGHSRDSEISLLSPEEAEIFEQEVDQYLLRKKREHRGEKLLYTISVL